MNDSILEHIATIHRLAFEMNTPSLGCPHCRPDRGCWMHPFHTQNLIRQRVLTRDQWLSHRHQMRERSREIEIQTMDRSNGA